MNNEPHLVEALRTAARDMDTQAKRTRIANGRDRWLQAAASTRLCAVLVSEGVRGFDATVGYAWLKASKSMIREATR